MDSSRKNISTMVARDHGGHTVSDAAKLIGRSPETLVRWRKNGTFVPRKKVRAGALTVYVYLPEDIETLRAIAAEQRPGRKPGTSEEEGGSR